jgi:hypothetical protein
MPEPRPLPATLTDKVENLTDQDFAALRNRTGDNHPSSYLDELPAMKRLSPEDIDDFKQELLTLKLEYFAAKLKEYLAYQAPVFIVDGTSALPYGYVFKAAFAEYQRLHPEQKVVQPRFALADAHPLRQLRETMEPNAYLAFIDQLQPAEYEDVWGQEGAAALEWSLEALAQLETGQRVIVFDEFSDPGQLGSLQIITRFLERRFPNLTFIASSPEADEASHSRQVDGKRYTPTGLIPSPHIFNPIKRVMKGVSRFRRPSPVVHPEAHEQGRAFIRELKELGKLVAEAVEGD